MYSCSQGPVLSVKVRNMVLQGWQNFSGKDLFPYQRCKYKLSVYDGCVLWDLELSYRLLVMIK